MIIDLFSQKSKPTKADKLMTDELRTVLTEIKKADTLFNEVTDPYEIESVIYRLKELETHYSFLIKRAKLDKLVSPELNGGITL